MSEEPNRRSRLLNFASKALPGRNRGDSDVQHQRLTDPTTPSMESTHEQSSTGHGDALAPPNIPFGERPRSQSGSGGGIDSSLSSRRSSFLSVRDGKNSPSLKERPTSLSVNYVPTKFTKLHAPGQYSHRREGKAGGGRDAFAADASRMGMMGTVDDDEGVVFQVGKGGLKKKTPKLRWNRFKWVLFAANTVMIIYGMATLIAGILVWLNVFYQSDVIRVGNRTELILSTVAASLLVLTSLLGYSGILLNNRAFLAVYTLLLWVCLAFMVAPGYMTYKQRTFNLEGKINSQWSRNLGTEGRLRIQDALRCCGYFSPFIEATQSPLCYPRSIFPGCKSRYLKLERDVLETWYTISFALVPPQIFIIIASLLCSNHITYRFGKGLTPKRYRLDLSSMAVIMDEYASQIAAQYGNNVAQQIRNRSSVAIHDQSPSPFGDEARVRADSFGSQHAGNSTGTQATLTNVTSRLTPAGSTLAPPSTYSNNGGRPRSALVNESDRYADSELDGAGDFSSSGHYVDNTQRRSVDAHRNSVGWAQ